MKVIYKYPLSIYAEGDFEIPTLAKGASIIFVGLDPRDKPCLWAETYTEWSFDNEFPGRRTFRIIGTGQEVPAGRHIGSWRSDTRVFVWHLYETTART